jgi:hypothetical protein
MVNGKYCFHYRMLIIVQNDEVSDTTGDDNSAAARDIKNFNCQKLTTYNL